jgi:spermidine synthase
MLLHEVLKYPTLELVIGLELDQAVTRRSLNILGHSHPGTTTKCNGGMAMRQRAC